jgi:hypothetical protein
VTNQQQPQALVSINGGPFLPLTITRCSAIYFEKKMNTIASRYFLVLFTLKIQPLSMGYLIPWLVISLSKKDKNNSHRFLAKIVTH